MGTYKVIQDIEAEDKLLGPLSLKQFIFACIALVCFYMSFFVVTKGLAWLATITLPPGAFFTVLAVPWSSTQPTEIWLLAKIRFYFKPNKRIWDQTGMKELVTITVPKKIEQNLTDGLTQSEVKSRLNALSSVIDSRGWAVKNVNVNLFSQPSYATVSSDRLIDPSTIPQEVPSSDVAVTDDMLDEANNPTAQHLGAMLQQTEQKRREQLVAQMQGQAPQPTAAPQDYWFMHQPDPSTIPQDMTTGQSKVVQPGSDDHNSLDPEPSEKELLEAIHKKQSKKPKNTHLKTIKPLSEQKEEKHVPKKEKAVEQKAKDSQQPAAAKPQMDPAILGLASRDDLNISTVARIANKQDEPPHNDEVVINLH